MIGLFNCQTSNLTSVMNALRHLGAQVRVINRPEEATGCERYILPGVGTFCDGMGYLQSSGLAEAIRDLVRQGHPLLGICLGMQLLTSSSEEGAPIPGLSLIPGCVRRICGSPRLPHVGWNDTACREDCPLFHDFTAPGTFYYLHSYAYCNEQTSSFVCATTEYGTSIPAAIWKDRVFGVQFHPEKSQEDGMRLLKNFLQRC